MLRTFVLSSLLALGLIAFAGAAEASPIDKVNDKIDYTERWACDTTGYTCVLAVPDLPDPFDPCTCPPID